MAHEFFVVCEGQTDYEVLKSVVAQVGKQNGLKYKTLPLFPPPTRPGIGGWDTLRTFIRNQASALAGNQARMRTDAALALGARPQAAALRNPNSGDKFAAALKLRAGATAAKIIIQLDTDVAHDFTDGTFPIPPFISYPMNAHNRELLAEAAVRQWLGNHVPKLGNDIVLCMCTHALETWLLAMHSKAEVQQAIGREIPANFDSIWNPDVALVQLGYASEPVAGGGRELRKRAATYAPYGARLAERLTTAVMNSSSLMRFCAAI